MLWTTWQITDALWSSLYLSLTWLSWARFLQRCLQLHHFISSSSTYITVHISFLETFTPSVAGCYLSKGASFFFLKYHLYLHNSYIYCYLYLLETSTYLPYYLLLSHFLIQITKNLFFPPTKDRWPLWLQGVLSMASPSSPNRQSDLTALYISCQVSLSSSSCLQNLTSFCSLCQDPNGLISP